MPNNTMPKKTPPPPPGARLIALDAHPDSFTAAILSGATPAAAIVEKMFDQVAIQQLTHWAKKHTTAQDLFVLEASGNSFAIVRQLAAAGRQAEVLESTHLGKLKEAHANNDKISAVRIGKAYLAGTAKKVWVPDPKTQERRDCFQAHRKSVKRTTQLRNRLLSYLSDYGVRLPKGTPLARGKNVAAQIRALQAWNPHQWRVISGMLLELQHAEAQRQYWRSLIAQEVLDDPQLLSLVRLCGVRDLVAFALGAIIGDIKRFAEARKLVKYIGLNPAFDDSGKETWSGGVAGHGRRDLRGLLIESAHSILRSKHPLAKWGAKLLRRKSSVKLTVCAVARKLTVAVWYLLMGRHTPLEEIDGALAVKVGKIITQVGAEPLKQLGRTRQQLREEAFTKLKTGIIYVLKPYPPAGKAATQGQHPVCASAAGGAAS